MPSRTKKNLKKIRKKYRKSTKLSLRKAPMPYRFATKLKYEDTLTLNPSLGGIMDVALISANSIYAPRVSGGHQPRGHDQFYQLYDHGIVVGSKIIVKFLPADDAQQATMKVGVALKDSSGSPASANDYIEGRHCRWSNMLQNQYGYPTKNTIKLTCSPKKFLGRTSLLSDPQLKNSLSAGPQEQAYFHIFAEPYGAIDPVSFYVQVYIEYLVVFVEPKNPSQS